MKCLLVRNIISYVRSVDQMQEASDNLIFFSLTLNKGFDAGC